MDDRRDVRLRARVLWAAAAMSGLALGGGCATAAPPAPQVSEVAGGAAADATERIVITGSARPAAPGEPAFPARVELEVGQVLAIENRSRFGAAVGPFFVPPGVTRSYRMESPGVYTGTCWVHPDGRFTLVVR